MPRLLFGYSFLYFSMYQYCSKVWGFSKDWPEFYAALIISIFLCFFVGGINFLSIALFSVDFQNLVASSYALSWMPEILRDLWYYLLITFFNMYYFVINRKWEANVEFYGKFPEEILSKSYWLSAMVLVVVLSLYLGAALSLAHVREAS